MTSFFRFHLRTHDVAAARGFYERVLGERALDIVPLDAASVARGARPMWLGSLDFADVERAVAAFLERGATRLGHPASAMLRDAGGAILGLASSPGTMTPTPVDWHLLHTVDVERAKANYGELCGWDFTAPLELGSLGVFHPFSWERGGPTVGAMSDLAARQGVHPQWLFHLRVANFEGALEAVRTGGGKVIATTLPSGDRIAACDDPQGAAFGLRGLPP